MSSAELSGRGARIKRKGNQFSSATVALVFVASMSKLSRCTLLIRDSSGVTAGGSGNYRGCIL
jgi:hypothetical protein